MTNLLNQALELADQFPVFPCNAKKQPVCSGGFKAATQDADELTRLFSNPNAKLIGMPTGEPSGISVVDIDVNDGKGGEAWLNTNKEKLGITKVVRTQSGGWHYYYKHQDGITNRAGISSCVDIRGDGGYVIVNPSVGYTLLQDEELIVFPDFLIGVQTSGSHDPNNSEQVTDRFGSVVDGREKYMSGLVYATIMNYIKDHNSLPTEEWMVENVFPTYLMKVKKRGGHDLEQDDRGITMFMKKVRSTIQKQQRQGVTVRGEFDDPLPTVDVPEFADEDEQGERKFRIPYLYNNDILDMPPPSFLIAPYVLKNTFSCLFGAPASYKSFLALDWALSLAHGVDWNGRVVDDGWVIYMAMEGQQGYKQRQEAWHKDNGLNMNDAKLATIPIPISLADPADEQSDILELIEVIKYNNKDKDIKLIVVDTLARSFTGKDENSAVDMGIFVRNTSLLMQEFDCSVLAVHHTGKDDAKGMRGSSALLGAIDSGFEIKRKSDTMNVCLSVKKQKDTEEADPLWMEAREVSWLENKFGIERTSLVLDPSDEPKKKPKPMSNDQVIALEILTDMSQNETILEKDFKGNYGVPENLWRENVANSLPKFGEGGANRQVWANFKRRLVDTNKITIINKLVAKI